MTLQWAIAVGPVATRALSTGMILCGLAIATVTLPVDTATNIFSTAAVCVALTLLIGTSLEGMSGIRTLIRVDILMLWVLYGLTFFEFLFRQEGVDAAVSPEAATSGTYAVLLGFAGLVIGRHSVPIGRSVGALSTVGMRSTDLFVLFVLATLVGYLHILLAVNFNPIEMLRQMDLPRFAQSWSRGKFGDVYSLLYELGMLISVIPPIAGLIYARGKEFGILQKAFVTAILALTFWYAFVGGTRSVFATYLITFGAAHLLAKPRIKKLPALLLGVLSLIVLIIGITYMLEFRNVGAAKFSLGDSHYNEVFVDRNIVNVSRLTSIFPDQYEFLGFEVPFNALVRPVPRVFWPGKPEGLSVGIEQALGVGNYMTVSCTFVGEAYMAGGFIAVVIFGLLLGAAAALWNRVDEPLNSPFSQVVYVSGFVCAAIAMRSVMSMVPLMLPTLALWIYGKVWTYGTPNRMLRPAGEGRSLRPPDKA
jgi:oligosaccharide repeat unit polymerase